MTYATVTSGTDRKSPPMIRCIAPCALASLLLIVSCKNNEDGASAKKEPGPSSEVTRVKVAEAGCEIGAPAGMTVAKASAHGFTLVAKGKDPLFDGVLVNIMPIGAMGSLAPPDAKDVKTTKDTKGPDGAVAREGSFNNGVQTLHVAEYVYPLGTDFLHCKIQAAKPERRDEVAKICAGLTPKKI